MLLSWKIYDSNLKLKKIDFSNYVNNIVKTDF